MQMTIDLQGITSPESVRARRRMSQFTKERFVEIQGGGKDLVTGSGQWLTQTQSDYSSTSIGSCSFNRRREYDILHGRLANVEVRVRREDRLHLLLVELAIHLRAVALRSQEKGSRTSATSSSSFRPGRRSSSRAPERTHVDSGSLGLVQDVELDAGFICEREKTVNTRRGMRGSCLRDIPQILPHRPSRASTSRTSVPLPMPVRAIEERQASRRGQETSRRTAEAWVAAHLCEEHVKTSITSKRAHKKSSAHLRSYPTSG